MKKYILLFIIIFTAFFVASCDGGNDLGPLESSAELTIPAHNASLAVSNVRVKGFTISWENLPNGEYEYAVAASYTGNITTYEEALENNNIILDFTADSILNGTYKATKLIPGKEYQIKLFARKKNTRAAEFLTAKTTLPYVDDAELLQVWLNDEETFYDSYEDAYTKAYLPGLDSKDIQDEYTVTYKLARQCLLYDINGELLPDEFTIKADETIEVTAVHEKLSAARDYIIAVKAIDNGIPVIILETEEQRPVTSNTEYLPVSVKMIDSEVNPYREGIFEGEMIIRARGSLALERPKRSYIIRTPDRSDVQLLNMTAAEDWVLLSNFTDKTLMRNYIAHELFRDMGAVFSPDLRFVDLVFNGEYAGTYMLGERVKLDKGRLELPKIRAEEAIKTDEYGRQEVRAASTPEELTGSYILELKSTDEYSNTEIIFETKRVKWSMGRYFAIQQPGETNLQEESYNYISKYTNEAEDALFSEDFKDHDIGYRAYFDTATFIDWYIVNELFKRVDSDFTDKIYFYKPRDGKLSMGPVWDFETAAGNINYADCDNVEGWHIRSASWFARLFEDEAFEQEFKDRWNYVKANHFDKMFKLIDNAAKLLEKSQGMNFSKWAILGVSIWPNDAEAASRKTYQQEVDYLKDWLIARIEWMDSEINK